jgi:hypothetical protein
MRMRIFACSKTIMLPPGSASLTAATFAQKGQLKNEHEKS